MFSSLRNNNPARGIFMHLRSAFIVVRVSKYDLCRFITYRKPKGPRDSPDKSLFRPKILKRGNLLKALKPEILPKLSEKIKPKSALPRDSKFVASNVSLQSKLDYLRVLSSIHSEDFSTNRSIPIPDKILNCVSEIAASMEFRTLDVCMKSVHRAIHLSKGHDQFQKHYKKIVKSVIIPRFLTLASNGSSNGESSLIAETAATTSDFVLMFEWLKRMDNNNKLVNDDLVRQQAQTMLELAFKTIVLEGNTSCALYGDLLYCAGKLDLQLSYWPGEMILSFQEASNLVTFDPTTDIMNASSIIHSIAKLGGKTAASNLLDTVLTKWLDCIMNTVADQRFDVHQEAKERQNVAHAVVNALYALASMGIKIHYSTGSHSIKFVPQIYSPALSQLIPVLMKIMSNTTELGYANTIQSLGVMNLKWEQLSPQLQDLFISLFALNWPKMTAMQSHNTLYGLWKIEAPLKKFLPSLEQESMFWSSIYNHLKEPNQKRNNQLLPAGFYLANIVTSLGSLHIQWEKDIPFYCQEAIIQSFIQKATSFSVQHLAMCIRGFGLLNLQCKDYIETNVNLQMAFEKSLQLLHPEFSEQSLSMVYLGFSKMGARWSKLTPSLQKTLTSIPLFSQSLTSKLSRSKYLEIQGVSIVMYSLTEIGASWASLPLHFQQYLWQSMKLIDRYPCENPSSIAMLIWSLGQMGWFWSDLHDNQYPNAMKNQLYEQLIQSIPKMDQLTHLSQVINGLMELDYPVSNHPQSEKLWFIVWKRLIYLLPQANAQSLVTLMRSLSCLFFDIPIEVYEKHTNSYLLKLWDCLLSEATRIKNSMPATADSSTMDAKPLNSQYHTLEALFIIFLHYGLPSTSIKPNHTSMAKVLTKFPQFQLPQGKYCSETNSYVLCSSQPSRSVMSTYHKKVAEKLLERLPPEEFSLVHEYAGMGDVLPVDIAVVYHYRDSNAKTAKKVLLGFVEVDGRFHYRDRHLPPPLIADTTRTITSIKKDNNEYEMTTNNDHSGGVLRRNDRLKKYMYQRRYPDAKFFLRVPPFPNGADLDKYLDQLAKSILEVA